MGVAVPQVCLLGRIAIGTPDSMREVRGAKQRLLLCLLASRPRHRVGRDRLIHALWGSDATARSGHALQAQVSRLRSTLRPLGDAVLVGEDGTYRLDVDDAQVDLTVIGREIATARSALRGGRADEAAAHAERVLGRVHGSPFGELTDHPALHAESRRVEEQLRQAEDLRIRARLAVGHHADVLPLLQQRVRDSPLDEAAWAQLMEAQYRAGRPADALASYQQLARILTTEVGSQPSPPLQRLHEHLLRHELGEPPQPADVAPAPAPAQGAPVSTGRGARLVTPGQSSFVGRGKELVELRERLLDPDVRLVTLLGPGGAGKTRLAAHAADELASHWADGATAVALAGVEAPQEDAADVVAAEIAAAVGCTPPEGVTASLFVRSVLADQHRLLVLDNLEQLAPAVADLLDDLVAGAPGVTILATSRRRLMAGSEWVVDLAGLDVPGAADTAVADVPAVRLFADRAAHVRRDFVLTDELDAVAELCRRVAGQPLAIELAAEATRAVSTRELVARIDRLELLTTDSNAITERHRSMRGLLDTTWHQLATEEQSALARLSVGRSAIDSGLADALGVLGTLPQLVDRSLLRRDDTGRWHIHELVRQYAADRLAERPAELDTARRRHAEHVAMWLHSHGDRLRDETDRGVLSEVDWRSADMHAAWRWHAEHATTETFADHLDDYHATMVRRSRFAELVPVLRSATRRDDAKTLLQARWHRWLGEAEYSVGDQGAAITSLRRALELTGGAPPTSDAVAILSAARGLLPQRTRRPPADEAAQARARERAMASQILGQIAFFEADPALFLWGGAETLRASQRTEDPGLQALAAPGAAIAAGALGFHRRAQRLEERVDALTTPTTSPSDRALALELRTVSRLARADHRTVDDDLATAIELFAAIGRARYEDESRLLLAHTLLLRGAVEDSLTEADRLVGAARGRGDRRVVAMGSLHRLEAACLRNDYALATEAAEQTRRALTDRTSDAERVRLHGTLARCHLQQGRTQAAAEAVEDAVRFWRGERLPLPWEALAYANTLAVLIDLGRVRDARWALRCLRRRTRSFPAMEPWLLEMEARFRRSRGRPADRLRRRAADRARALGLDWGLLTAT